MIAASCALGGRSGHRAGRLLLEQLYRQATGAPLPNIRLTPRGKPYFEQSPWHFSITHTDRHAFCVLSHAPVGIDAEELDRPVRFSLAKRIFSPAEQQRFALSSNPQEAFLSLWVLKEADVKRSGLGLTGFPNRTDFSPEDPRVYRWLGCVVAILGEEEGVEFYDF